MNNKLGTLIGVLVLAAGGVGVYFLFRSGSPVVAEPEKAIETVVPVKVAQIRRRTMHDYVRAYGSIVPDPGLGDCPPASVSIKAPMDGQLSKVECVIGQEVQQGQALFVLYDQPAKLAVEQAKKAVTFAQENLNRQEKLKKVQGTSAKLYLEAQQQLDVATNQLEQAQTELDLLKVVAPFDGTVMDVRARAGQAVLQTDSLARLTDLKRLVACMHVPGPEAAKVKAGQRVEFENEPSDQQDPLWVGQVKYVDPQVDPNDDTVTAWVSLPTEAVVHPGQFVQGRIISAEYSDCLVVPRESVVTTPEGQTIVAVVSGDEATPTPIKRGVSEGDWVAIEGQGLEPGMSVATVGAYGLPGKTKIRVMGP